VPPLLMSSSSVEDLNHQICTAHWICIAPTGLGGLGTGVSGEEGKGWGEENEEPPTILLLFL